MAWQSNLCFKKKKSKLAKILFAKEKTLGLRIPNYKLIDDLLKELKLPLIGTSANISGRPASTKIKEVISQFQNQRYQPDLVLDAGDPKPSQPSTVIDLTAKELKILRLGSLTKNLRKFLIFNS